MNKHVDIYLKDFSKEPFGRYLKDGPFSGEVFRNTILVPLLSDPDITQVTVYFDGLDIDLGSSFLEEAFGGLIRNNLVPSSLLDSKLIIKSSEKYDEMRVADYIQKAKLSSQGYAAIQAKS